MTESSVVSPRFEESEWRPLLNAMVEKLVAGAKLEDARVEAALREVPRHLFCDGASLQEVYTGDVLQTLADEAGKSISTASHVNVVASMLQQLDAKPGESVLEVGLGTGYNAALIGRLVAPGGTVTAIDLEPSLVERARISLERLGIQNVRTLAGDGWLGDLDGAPYDAIVATVGVSDISPHWFDQLRDGGRLVLPLWLGSTLSITARFDRVGEALEASKVARGWFLMLKGPHSGDGGYVAIGEHDFFMRHRSSAAVEVLQRLLEQEPSVSVPLPDLDITWRLWLALEDANAFITTTDLVGVFDAERPGLAYADHSKRVVAGHGDVATFERLVELMSSGGRLPMRVLPSGARVPDITVEIVPIGSTPRPQDGWLMTRPSFDLVIRPNASERED